MEKGLKEILAKRLNIDINKISSDSKLVDDFKTVPTPYHYQ